MIIVQHQLSTANTPSQRACNIAPDVHSSSVRQGTVVLYPELDGSQPMACQRRIKQLTHADLARLISQHYAPESENTLACDGVAISSSRICGAWVQVLTKLGDQHLLSSLLSSAMQAFAISLSSGEPRTEDRYFQTYDSVL